MSLTSEQKAAVAAWVAAGDSLSTVQKKLAEQFKVALTYRDVRFLVDDLDLQLKDAAPKVDSSDVTKVPPPAARAAAGPAGVPGPQAPAEAGFAEDELPDDAMDDEGEADAAPFPDDDAGAASGVSVNVDNVTLIPGALASGTVTFSDGVTGKWIVDQYGRPGFTEVSQPGYRPKPGDAQAFMQQLSRALQQRGF